MNRTAFLIDGFNLYHSLRDASRDLGMNGAGTRWLNIRALCSSYLHALGNNAQIAGIYYFSALARHLESVKPDVVGRHRNYLEGLEDSGITVELARFKEKRIRCAHCGKRITRHEEKETDVAIASRLLQLVFGGQCDTAVLVTGDTDMLPAVRLAQQLYPHVEIVFLMPYHRHNTELAQAAARHFDIKKETYVRHQFTNPLITVMGKHLIKPSAW